MKRVLVDERKFQPDYHAPVKSRGVRGRAAALSDNEVFMIRRTCANAEEHLPFTDLYNNLALTLKVSVATIRKAALGIGNYDF